MSVPSLALRPIRAAWLVACLALACSPEPTAYQLEAPSLNKGKGGGGGGGGSTTFDPTVAGVNPSFGRQGQILAVRITGSGYEPDARVAWERNGLPDPAIAVLATRFISSTELETDIQIDGDADVALYDVAVTLKSGKRGVGIESFEVTTAVVVGSFCSSSSGFSQSFAANDAGAVVGLSCEQAFFWEPGGTIVNLGSQVASDLARAGNMVVGRSGDKAAVWTRSGPGGAWSSPALLPANGWTGRANRVASDASGNAWILGGRVDRPLNGKKKAGEPAIWLRNGTEWRLVILPRPSWHKAEDLLPIFGISGSGRAVSRMSSAVWEPVSAGSDQYNVSALPGGGSGRGISPNGEWIVGQHSAHGAVYWQRSSTGSWTGPVALNSACTSGWANDVNDHGIVVGRGCNGGAAWRIHPNGTVEEIRLSGLGKLDSSQEAWGVNNSQPARAAGNGVKSAVYWDLPW